MTENLIFDTLETYTETHFTNGTNKGKNEIKELDLQITQMVEKSDGVWKCKVCEKITSKNKGHIWEHAETHIGGMSHACHICDKSLSSRKSLRLHISAIHSEQLFCELCGKSGLNKNSYREHKKMQHKPFS